MSDSTRRRIEDIIASGDVILFMKGSRSAPMRLSAAVVQILSQLVVPFNLSMCCSDLEVREGSKPFRTGRPSHSFMSRAVLGGCDIVREMYQAGELTTLLSKQRHRGGSNMTATGDTETKPAIEIPQFLSNHPLRAIRKRPPAIPVEAAQSRRAALWID